MPRDIKSYNILVLEDNLDDLLTVGLYLQDYILNPNIINATTFKQASAILSSGEIQFDIILLDLSLPDENGQHLVNRFLMDAPDCPVIILTGYSDMEFSKLSISQGISDYLLKDELNGLVLYKSIIYSIERKKANAVRKESEKRNSDLFDLSPQPMWVQDALSGRFIQVNKAAIEHYGYSEEEFMCMTTKDILASQELLDASQIIDFPQTKKEGIYKGKFHHHKKSNEIIVVEIFSTDIILNTRNVKSVIAIDITEKSFYEHKIVKAIIKTQEDERYEIGGELHDNICQILAAGQISLSILKSSVTTPGMKWLDQCKENIDSALESIRNLSHRLAPIFFDDSNLEEAFQRLFDSFTPDNHIKLKLFFDDAAKSYPISKEIQLNLYRILQEQLRNIFKHANASMIDVEVLIYHNTLKMRISDNGIGFDINAHESGIGLANIKRRAELFSGRCEIISTPGNGCEIKVDIPLKGIHQVTTLTGLRPNVANM